MGFDKKDVTQKNEAPGSPAKTGSQYNSKPTDDQRVRPTQSGANQPQRDFPKNADKQKNIDSERHPQEKNV